MLVNRRILTAISRRRFVSGSAAALFTGAALLGVPAIVRAKTPIKIGLVHPVSGFLAYSGGQCRAGALMAIEEINRTGGIHSMGGARLEPMLGDARSRPDVGAAEVEKMNEAGVVAIVGAYASSMSRTSSKSTMPQADLPER
jgi:branched-chain amino acid transport system substrate-binding protein